MDQDVSGLEQKHGWRQALGFKHDRKGWQRLWLRFASDRDVKKDETKG